MSGFLRSWASKIGISFIQPLSLIFRVQRIYNELYPSIFSISNPLLFCLFLRSLFVYLWSNPNVGFFIWNYIIGFIFEDPTISLLFCLSNPNVRIYITWGSLILFLTRSLFISTLLLLIKLNLLILLCFFFFLGFTIKITISSHLGKKRVKSFHLKYNRG